MVTVTINRPQFDAIKSNSDKISCDLLVSRLIKRCADIGSSFFLKLPTQRPEMAEVSNYVNTCTIEGISVIIMCLFHKRSSSAKFTKLKLCTKNPALYHPEITYTTNGFESRSNTKS